MSAFEEHYTVQAVAKVWGLSDDTKSWQLSIPESVPIRVYQKLSS